MKLRNKKTGEIGELSVWRRADNDELTGFAVIKENEKFPTDYNSLAGLNAEWEDVSEEPKVINEVDVVLDAIGEYCNEHSFYSGDLEKIKILNTVEEKLKAWKRLKDGGFVFCGKGDCLDTIKFDYGPAGYNNQDFNLLFGGEE